MLRQWDNFHNQKANVQSPFNTISFIQYSKDILSKSFIPQTISDVTNRECMLTNFNFDVNTQYFLIMFRFVSVLMSSYEWLICWLLKITSEKINSELASGKSRFEARNNSQVYRASILTKVYSEYLVLFYCAKAIPKLSNDLQPVIQRMFNLYGLSALDKHLIYFYQGGYTNTSKFADIVKEAILNLCSELKPDAVAIVDALAPTDFILNSVIGKSDGFVSTIRQVSYEISSIFALILLFFFKQLYQNLQAKLLHDPGALERPSWWKEIVKSKL